MRSLLKDWTERPLGIDFDLSWGIEKLTESVERRLPLGASYLLRLKDAVSRVSHPSAGVLNSRLIIHHLIDQLLAFIRAPGHELGATRRLQPEITSTRAAHALIDALQLHVHGLHQMLEQDRLPQPAEPQTDSIEIVGIIPDIGVTPMNTTQPSRRGFLLGPLTRGPYTIH